MNIKTIRSIANKIRRKCEKFAISKASEDYDFHGNKDLSCMCAVASYVLAEALRKQGIKCEVIRGYFSNNGFKEDYEISHCWVEVGKTLIDITATQFSKANLPPVYVSKTNDKKYNAFQIVTDYDFLRNWMGQKPSPEVTKKILTIAA